MFEGAAVRGALVRLPAAATTIVAAHPYPPALARALAELAAASVLLASTLKLDGSLLLQIAGDGPVRLAVVECTGKLDLRATAQWDEARVRTQGDAATLVALSGGARGRMTITLDPRDAGTLYQGIVALEADDGRGLDGALPRDVRAVGEPAPAVRERGPRRGPAAPAAAGIRCGRGRDMGTASHAHSTQSRPPTWMRGWPGWNRSRAGFPTTICACSTRARCARAAPAHAERVENALVIAGRDEIEAALAERGNVEVTCEFCNRRYSFTPDEARAVFTQRASGEPAQ